MKKIVMIISLFGFFALGCSDNRLIYEKFQTLEGDLWNANEMIEFSFDVSEDIPFDVAVEMRNTDKYPKANLWLFITTKSPDGKIQQDTLDCSLADDYGYWLGDGFSGLYATSHKLYKRGENTQGKWKITIQQAMRQDTIVGIRDVGIVVKSLKK